MNVEDIRVSEELGNNVLIDLRLDNGGAAWTWLTRGEDAEHVLLQLKFLVSKLEFWVNRNKDGE